jgi:hypothetical protein
MTGSGPTESAPAPRCPIRLPIPTRPRCPVRPPTPTRPHYPTHCPRALLAHLGPIRPPRHRAPRPRPRRTRRSHPSGHPTNHRSLVQVLSNGSILGSSRRRPSLSSTSCGSGITSRPTRVNAGSASPRKRKVMPPSTAHWPLDCGRTCGRCARVPAMNRRLPSSDSAAIGTLLRFSGLFRGG